MKHNRPLYGQKVSVIIVVQGDPANFYISMQKWLEQIYNPYNVIVLDVGCKQNLRSHLMKVAHNHGKGFSHSDLDADVSLVEMKQWNEIEAVDFITEKTTSPVVCFAPTDHVPSAYFLDVAMMALRPGHVAWRGQCRISTKGASGNAIKLTPGCMLSPGEIPEQPKVTVFIPVMNREANIRASLPHWFGQRYANRQICIVDYSSAVPIFSAIEEICGHHNKTLSTDMMSDADVIVHRIDEMKFFNISHAYNHAIVRSKTDIVCTACADSVPWDYYLEAAISTLSPTSMVQIHWGLHTLTYQNWLALNGHQEFIVGWGAEDDDFRVRANLMGLDVAIIPSKLVYQIPTELIVKSENREIKDLSESSLINLARFQKYIADNGYVANYRMTLGSAQPIGYKTSTPAALPLRLWCFHSQTMDKQNLPPEIKYNETFDLFYHVGREEFDCGIYTHGDPYDHFFMGSESDVDKYLFQCRKNDKDLLKKFDDLMLYHPRVVCTEFHDTGMIKQMVRRIWKSSLFRWINN
jgi:glycosyltransferase involved in cell wall biosynthesis